MAGERTVEPRPVLETATRLKTDFRQEVCAPKATSSSEHAADRAEDPGAEFRQNVAFMRETLPQEVVSQPAPVQLKAVPMSTNQVEETPKVEVPLSLFVKAMFVELSSELAGCTDTPETAHSGEGLTRGKPLAKPSTGSANRRTIFVRWY